MKNLVYGVWFYIKAFFVGLPQKDDSKCVVPQEEKKETKKTTRKHGQKLDCKVIIWCRNQFSKGESIRSLADKMGVTNSTLSRAIAGKTYKKCKGK